MKTMTLAERIEVSAVKHKILIYIFLFLTALFMHLFWLDRVPWGIHIDEAGMAYDAWCLANFKVDRYLNYMPVYLINFGGGQSALYAYLTAIFIKLGGGDISMWAMRLPGAIIALIAWIAGIQIVRSALGEKWGIAAAFLLTIFPYFTMQSRFGLDCNLLLGITTIGLYVLMQAMKKRKTVLFILAGIVWGISYYTYALSFISTSLFLGGTLLYWLYHKKIKISEAVVFALPVFFIALPLALMILINKFDLPEIKTALFTIPKLPEFRASDLGLGNLWKNLVKTVKDILSKDWLDYNAFDKYFTMYRLSIPFAVIGFLTMCVNAIKSFIYKRYSVWNVFLLLFLANLAVSMMMGGNGPNINRANGIFFALFLCVIYGIRYCYHWFKRYLSGKAKPDSLKDALKRVPAMEKKLFLLVLTVYGINFLTFARYYFLDYPDDMNPQYLFNHTYEEMLPFIETETGEPKTVYVDSSYIYYFLSARVDPFEADIRNNGSDTYWKFAFYLPDEAEDNEIYLVRRTNREFQKMLEGKDYETHQTDEFILYYKK